MSVPIGLDKLLLIVDDDRDIRKTLALCLSAEGYRVVEAANGQEALDILELERPAAILLDLMMPVMDGWAFCEEQRRTGDVTPIVLLSASGGLEAQARELRVAAFIAKPFDIDRVVSTIEKVC